MDARTQSQLLAAGFDPKKLPPGTVIDGKPLSQLSGEGQRVSPPADRYKSKAERLYADRLAWRKEIGEIIWWAYEPVTLVIVDAEGGRCRFTPDFMAVTPEGTVWFYEVKGHLREAARVRFLAACERYPFWTFQMVRRDRNGGWSLLL